MPKFTVLTAIITLYAALPGWTQQPDPRTFSTERVKNLMVQDHIVWPEPRKTDSGANPQSAKTVVAQSIQAEDAETRRRGMEGMFLTSPETNIDKILTALSDPDPGIRDIAARALLKCERKRLLDRVLVVICGGAPDSLAGTDAALPALKDSLEEPLVAVLEAPEEAAWRKNGAGYCLGRMKSSVAIPLLADGALSPDPVAAMTFVNALLATQDPVAVPKLEALAAHQLPEVRRRVVEGLGALGGPESLAALGRLALSAPAGDDAISRKAALLLGATRNPAVAPMLIDALEKNPAVEHAAVSALRQIAQEDYDTDVEEWRKWYARSQGYDPDADAKREAAKKEAAEKAEQEKDNRSTVQRLWDRLKPKPKPSKLPQPQKIHIEGSGM